MEKEFVPQRGGGVTNRLCAPYMVLQKCPSLTLSL